MILNPWINPTPNRPTVQIREPFDKVDLNKELPRILKAQGWAVGVYFDIQFIDRVGHQLLRDATFVVTADDEVLTTTEEGMYRTKTESVPQYKFEQISDWRVFDGSNVPRSLADLEGEAIEVLDSGASVSGGAMTIRHKGGGVWEVLDPDGYGLATFTKDEGGKAAAEAFVQAEAA